MTRDHMVEVFDSHKGCESMARSHKCDTLAMEGMESQFNLRRDFPHVRGL